MPVAELTSAAPASTSSRRDGCRWSTPCKSTDPVSDRSIQVARQNHAAVRSPTAPSGPPIVATARSCSSPAASAAVLLVALGIWVIIRDKDGNEVARDESARRGHGNDRKADRRAGNHRDLSTRRSTRRRLADRPVRRRSRPRPIKKPGPSISARQVETTNSVGAEDDPDSARRVPDGQHR